jgi:D-alanine--D-alanine ligase
LKEVVLLPKNILFVYNQVSKKYKYGLLRECTLDTDVRAIRKALVETKNNILSIDLYNPEQLDSFIVDNYPIDYSFILAEGYKDYPHTLYDGSGAARIRRQLKSHNIPFSHGSIESLEICRNKDLTYEKLQEYNIPIPKYFVIDLQNRLKSKEVIQKIESVGYPLMVKPAGGGDSIGITPKSVIHNLEQLKYIIEYLRKTLGQEKLIIEQYLPGQEYTVGILGGKSRYIFPIIAFPEDWGIRYTKKKNKEYKFREQLKIIGEKHPLFPSLIDISIKSFLAVKAGDIIRLDIKEDKEGNIYIIDINGNPALTANGSVTFMANKMGLSHSELIQVILYESMIRNKLTPNDSFEKLIIPLKEKLQPYAREQLIETLSVDTETE